MRDGGGQAPCSRHEWLGSKPQPASAATTHRVHRPCLRNCPSHPITARPPCQVTVLDKSRADWKDFKKTDETIEEELEMHKRSGDQVRVQLGRAAMAWLGGTQPEQPARRVLPCSSPALSQAARRKDNVACKPGCPHPACCVLPSEPHTPLQRLGAMPPDLPLPCPQLPSPPPMQYLDKQAFLKDAELREYEKERDRRLASDVRNRGRL